MSGEHEGLVLTEDLSLVPNGRPAGNGPAWVESGLRRRLLRRLRLAIVITATTILLWVAGFWYLTRPFHEDWPRTAATVELTDQFYTKGAHCQVYLGITSSGQTRTVLFSGYAPCSDLPSRGQVVTVAIDPDHPDSLRIIGYDGPAWADIGFAATILALPVLWSSPFVLTSVVRFRRARKAGGDRPWQELTARFVSRSLYKGTVSARLEAVDADGKERTFFVSGSRKDLSGFVNAPAGAAVTFWLTGDGHGNVLVNHPGSGRPTPGSIYVPNNFELRTLT